MSIYIYLLYACGTYQQIEVHYSQFGHHYDSIKLKYRFIISLVDLFFVTRPLQVQKRTFWKIGEITEVGQYSKGVVKVFVKTLMQPKGPGIRTDETFRYHMKTQNYGVLISECIKKKIKNKMLCANKRAFHCAMVNVLV